MNMILVLGNILKEVVCNQNMQK